MSQTLVEKVDLLASRVDAHDIRLSALETHVLVDAANVRKVEAILRNQGEILGRILDNLRDHHAEIRGQDKILMAISIRQDETLKAIKDMTAGTVVVSE